MPAFVWKYTISLGHNLLRYNSVFRIISASIYFNGILLWSKTAPGFQGFFVERYCSKQLTGLELSEFCVEINRTFICCMYVEKPLSRFSFAATRFVWHEVGRHLSVSLACFLHMVHKVKRKDNNMIQCGMHNDTAFIAFHLVV